jgi:hypothetical protein
MTDLDADLPRRVLSQISTQRQTLAQVSVEADVARFHEQLARLDQAGYDVAEFHLDPERDLFYLASASDAIRGEKTVGRHGEQKIVSPGVLEAKMDAVLTYFCLDAEKKPIGFDALRKA